MVLMEPDCFRCFYERKRVQSRLIKYEAVTVVNAVGSSIGEATTNPITCSKKTLLFCIFVFLCLLYIPLYYPSSAFARNKAPTVTEAMVEGWESNKSRWLPTYVLPHEETMVLQTGLGRCHSSLTLLVVVCSAVTNFRERSAIRSTWASFKVESPLTYQVVFLLGIVNNTTAQEIVKAEALAHNDIIQENFYDTYNNLTLKSVMLLKQVVRYCQDVRYILKSDDDMFIHIPNLLNLIIHLDNLNVRDLLLGELICDAKPIIDATSKWYCPRYMFDGSVYPRYLSGTSYLMDKSVATRLYEAALVTPLFHLEDVYITGLCAKKAKLKPRDHGGFSYTTRAPDPCLYVKSKYLITSHRITPEKMENLWSRIKKQNETLCSSASRWWSRNNSAARRLRLPLPNCRSN